MLPSNRNQEFYCLFIVLWHCTREFKITSKSRSPWHPCALIVWMRSEVTPTVIEKPVGINWHTEQGRTSQSNSALDVIWRKCRHHHVSGHWMLYNTAKVFYVVVSCCYAVFEWLQKPLWYSGRQTGDGSLLEEKPWDFLAVLSSARWKVIIFSPLHCIVQDLKKQISVMASNNQWKI